MSGQYRFFEKSGYTANAGYDFFQSVYDDISSQNFQSHTGEISFARAIRKWELGLDYSFNYNFLDKKDFLQIQTLSPRVSLQSAPWLYTQFSYSLQEKVFFRDSSRDAIAHIVGLSQFFFFDQNKGFLLIGGRVETENADGSQFDFRGYGANASLRFPLSWLHYLLAGVFPETPWDPLFLTSVYYRLKDFTDTTPEIDRERKDETWTFQFSLETKLFLGIYGIIRFRHTKNDSNFNVVQYNENTLSLLIGHRF